MHFNIVPMCRSHHTLQHQKGHVYMFENYPGFRYALVSRGWRIHYEGGVKTLRREF